MIIFFKKMITNISKKSSTFAADFNQVSNDTRKIASLAEFVTYENDTIYHLSSGIPAEPFGTCRSRYLGADKAL